MIYTYPYDSAYFGPAMPVVDIAVSAPHNANRKISLRALVDSGADGTMIPVTHLQQLGAKIVDRRRMRGSDNISYPVDIYAILLEVGPLGGMMMEVTGNRFGDETIIGRDLLNLMIVTLNGLAQVTEISE
jgi:hypothetical protein